jgi:hypothetical protein
MFIKGNLTILRQIYHKLTLNYLIFNKNKIVKSFFKNSTLKFILKK